MTREVPYTDQQLAEFGLQRDRMPRHIAVIMDGNGRWAQQRGLPRIEGHRRGVTSVREIVEESSRLGMQQWVGPAGDGKITADPVRLQQELGLP